MIRLKGRVEYESGRVEEFETGTAALADWEMYALRHKFPIGADAPPMLSSMYVAYSALGIAEGFDVWRKSVSGIELETPEAVPPTLPAVSVEA